jgi:hypothetical protein
MSIPSAFSWFTLVYYVNTDVAHPYAIGSAFKAKDESNMTMCCQKFLGIVVYVYAFNVDGCFTVARYRRRLTDRCPGSLSVDEAVVEPNPPSSLYFRSFEPV